MLPTSAADMPVSLNTFGAVTVGMQGGDRSRFRRASLASEALTLQASKPGLRSRDICAGGSKPGLSLLSLAGVILLQGSPLGRTLRSLRGRSAQALLCRDSIACKLGCVARVSSSLVGKIVF